MEGKENTMNKDKGLEFNPIWFSLFYLKHSTLEHLHDTVIHCILVTCVVCFQYEPSHIKVFDIPYRPTDDEVVYSKRLGNKVLVDLNRSNPLTVIWDALVGQKIQTFSFSYSCHLDSHPSLTIVYAFSRCHPAPPIVLARSRLGTVGLFLVHFHLMKARGTLPKRRVRTNVTWWLCEIVVGELWAREKPPWIMTPLVCRDSVLISLPSIVESFSGLLREHQALSLIQRVSHSFNEVQTPHTWCILFQMSGLCPPWSAQEDHTRQQSQEGPPPATQCVHRVATIHK